MRVSYQKMGRVLKCVYRSAIVKSLSEIGAMDFESLVNEAQGRVRALADPSIVEEDVGRHLNMLVDQGLVQNASAGYRLTEEGAATAQRLAWR